MSEVYSIFLSAVFSSFLVTMGIIVVIGSLYYLTFKCFASYISFDKIAQKRARNLKNAPSQENSIL
ncbi:MULTISPECIES: hypothetical protein [unclassified Sulfurospirillum]|uniref:hypothetical protein n=1 Tax=unclassified Sulfurospirillum TaxID=2618290 RepID=UPI000508B746|nr:MULTISPECIES: hypothetical protein [unclassified Sulfurospirillum]KFL33977.1 hypothetical protein JU57_08685 [Sulfurospirillum sp. SCADC]